MKFKISPTLIFLGLATIATLFGYSWFLNSPYFSPLYVWAQQYFIVLVLLIISVKVIGIIWPPLPGGLVSMALIPLIGFIPAYLADLTGSLMGSAVGYFIGKKYGKSLIEKIAGEGIAEQASRLKIKEGKEMEAIIVLRVIGAAVLVEAVSFGSGMLKIDFRKFLIATFISHLIVVLPAFYIYSRIYQIQNSQFLAAILLLSIPLLWKLKNRYFE